MLHGKKWSQRNLLKAREIKLYKKLLKKPVCFHSVTLEIRKDFMRKKIEHFYIGLQLVKGSQKIVSEISGLPYQDKTTVLSLLDSSYTTLRNLDTFLWRILVYLDPEEERKAIHMSISLKHLIQKLELIIKHTERKERL